MSSEAPATTLQDAHRQVAHLWPGRHATAAGFRAYHEQAAQVYERVAESDPDHHHEALFLARQERNSAEEFARRGST